MAFKYRTQEEIKQSQENYAKSPEWIKNEGNSFNKTFGNLPERFGTAYMIFGLAALACVFTPLWYISIIFAVIFGLGCYADYKGPVGDAFWFIFFSVGSVSVIRMIFVYLLVPLFNNFMA